MKEFNEKKIGELFQIIKLKEFQGIVKNKKFGLIFPLKIHDLV